MVHGPRAATGWLAIYGPWTKNTNWMVSHLWSVDQEESCSTAIVPADILLVLTSMLIAAKEGDAAGTR